MFLKNSEIMSRFGNGETDVERISVMGKNSLLIGYKVWVGRIRIF
jgi:hypothetical protein